MPPVRLRRTAERFGSARPVAVVPRASDAAPKPPAREERAKGARKLAASDFLRDQDLTGEELVLLLAVEE